MGSLRNRLILSHVLLTLLAALLTGSALVYLLESRVVLANLSTQLARQAGLLAEIAGDYPAIWGDQGRAREFVDRFRRQTTAQLMLLDAGGQIVASSDPRDAGLLGQTLADPCLKTVLDGEQTVQLNYSHDLRAEIVDVFVPVFDPDRQVVGVVRLTHLLGTVYQRFQLLRDLVVEVLAASAVLSIAVGLVLAITLERPLERLTGAIHRLVRDERLDPLPEQGPADIRLLVGAFNSLVERLHTLRLARQRLLANLVHELRRPLGALAAANQALLQGAAEDPCLRAELLAGTGRELRSLQRLVDDLARFSGQTMGALELDLKPTALQEWLPGLLGTWREAALEKGLEWQATLPDGLPALPVDPDRLGQAIGNLLSNAIKYTPAGGTISVSAGVKANAVWLRVSDTGAGIAPEDQPHIFEPFYRGRAKNRCPQGMGLGLPIARDLIAAHGGRLEVETSPDLGSHFTVRLPLTS